MFESWQNAQFPFSGGLVVLPILTGGMLAMWSLVFIRGCDPAVRASMFYAILLPSTVAGMVLGCAGVWNAPLFDPFGYPRDFRDEVQTSLFLAFLASGITIPLTGRLTPAISATIDRLRQRQVSLFLLIVSAGLAGPLLFVGYTLLHNPIALVFISLQYTVFGFILWQLTRPVPLEEDSVPHA